MRVIEKKTLEPFAPSGATPSQRTYFPTIFLHRHVKTHSGDFAAATKGEKRRNILRRLNATILRDILQGLGEKNRNKPGTILGQSSADNAPRQNIVGSNQSRGDTRSELDNFLVQVNCYLVERFFSAVETIFVDSKTHFFLYPQNSTFDRISPRHGLIRPFIILGG